MAVFPAKESCPGARDRHQPLGPPAGTEDIYKIHAESFKGNDHPQHILKEAQAIVDEAIAARIKSQFRELTSSRSSSP